MTEPDVFVTVLDVAEMFVDHTYQRKLDSTRIRRLVAGWDRRMVGIVEVSDRGADTGPRYAIVDGQHRWAAAQTVDSRAMLAVNVHSGLTVADEAHLFDTLNRDRKATSGWDHWKARAAAGDPDVTAITAVADERGFIVNPAPADGNIGAVAALELVVKLGGVRLLGGVLDVITGAWGRRRTGVDAPILRGVALVLHHLDSIDCQRLVYALAATTPRQISSAANGLKDLTGGTLPTRTALAVVEAYNRAGRGRIEATARTFAGGGRNARSPYQPPLPPSQRPPHRSLGSPAALSLPRARPHRNRNPPRLPARRPRSRRGSPRQVVWTPCLRSPATATTLPPR